MNDLFEGVTSWIAETYDGLCSEIGAGIQEKDASRVMVNALLVVGFTGGMSAVVVGVCALAAYFWEWLIIPAIIVAFVIIFLYPWPVAVLPSLRVQNRVR